MLAFCRDVGCSKNTVCRRTWTAWATRPPHLQLLPASCRRCLLKSAVATPSYKSAWQQPNDSGEKVFASGNTFCITLQRWRWAAEVALCLDTHVDVVECWHFLQLQELAAAAISEAESSQDLLHQMTEEGGAGVSLGLLRLHPLGRVM